MRISFQLLSCSMKGVVKLQTAPRSNCLTGNQPRLRWDYSRGASPSLNISCRSVATESIRFLKTYELDICWSPGVPTMVLSETLRLQLFQVNRGGIGSSSGTPRFSVGPQDRLILTLELSSSELGDHFRPEIYSGMARSDDLYCQRRQFLGIETLSFLPHS